MSEMTMVEVVARALFRRTIERNRRWDTPNLNEERVQASINYSWPEFVDDARAAIAAMRSPTRLMIMEGDYVARTAEATWHAMIDCALCEVSEEPQAHQRARQEDR